MPDFEQYEFDLHGIVGIRLVDATRKDRDIVLGQVGPIQKPLNREPDITIRFVDKLPVSSTVRLIGLDDAAYTEDTFLVLKGQFKTSVRVAIPFDQLGTQCEIVCERGLISIPMLIAIINLTALNNGYLPLHSTAFEVGGKGVVTTGWSKGGKTETLLGFMDKGARHIGDEWVYFNEDGTRIWGIPEPMRIWDWHLYEMPRIRALISRKKRNKLWVFRTIVNTLNNIVGSGSKKLPAWKVTLGRIADVLKRQMYIQLVPEKLFGRESCPMAGRPDQYFFLASHESPEVVVEEMDAKELASRMLFSLQEEQAGLMSYYWKYRFAFPDKPNTLLENIQETQQNALEKILEGKKAFAVYHPYPVPIPEMYNMIMPLLIGEDAL